MKLFGDYHTHTKYSHGTGTVFDNACAAAEQGLAEIAITDHGFRHLLYHTSRSKLPDLRRDAENAEKETGVRVLVGVESNLIGTDGFIDVTDEDIENLDIILCGFHKMIFPHRLTDAFSCARLNLDWIFGHSTKRQIERNTDMYLRALDKYPIDIITHINYGAKVNLKRIAYKCAEHGTYLELNGKRVSFSPDDFLEMLETPVLFIANSDAHSPQRMGDVSLVEDFLGEVYVPSERIVNFGADAPVFRSRNRTE